MAIDFSMVAPHSRRVVGEDEIFKVNREALQAAKKFGSGSVVNASVGSLLNDEGKLAVLPSVIDVLRNLDAEDFAAYAPIAGMPDYLDTVKKAAFRGCMPHGFTEAVATPGGTGAIRHTVWNYSELGDSILTADWYWGPYKTIAEEHGRKLETFLLFDENYNFNTVSFREKVDEILSRQKRAVILLNSPSNNPTGYNLSDDEWDDVIRILSERAENMDNKIVLFVDIAYIDYAGPKDEGRRFMTKFQGLPENVLVIISFSMSKGYTLYGMRSGAMICLSSNEGVAKEFKSAGEFSNRGVWSNGTRPAMVVLTKIFKDSSLFEKVEAEREILRNMLNRRAAAFIEESKKANLTICPYKSGFFISIPCGNSKEMVERLKKYNIFAVPIQKGIRFAICSVSEEKCARVPSKIAEVLK